MQRDVGKGAAQQDKSWCCSCSADPILRSAASNMGQLHAPRFKAAESKATLCYNYLDSPMQVSILSSSLVIDLPVFLRVSAVVFLGPI